MEHGTWNMEHVTWNMEHGTWNIEHLTLNIAKTQRTPVRGANSPSTSTPPLLSLCSRKGDEKFKEIKEKYLINDQHIPVIKN
jgi:hypothetical protein